MPHNNRDIRKKEPSIVTEHTSPVTDISKILRQLPGGSTETHLVMVIPHTPWKTER